MNQKNARKERKRRLRSQICLAAILRTGAGVHGDRRLKRQNRQSWRKDDD